LLESLLREIGPDPADPDFFNNIGPEADFALLQSVDQSDVKSVAVAGICDEQRSSFCSFCSGASSCANPAACSSCRRLTYEGQHHP